MDAFVPDTLPGCARQIGQRYENERKEEVMEVLVRVCVGVCVCVGCNLTLFEVTIAKIFQATRAQSRPSSFRVYINVVLHLPSRGQELTLKRWWLPFESRN